VKPVLPDDIFEIKTVQNEFFAFISAGYTIT